LKFFLGRRKWIYVGDVLLGFGLIFFGLATMQDGFAPLKDHPSFVALFTRFNADDMLSISLCILVGTIMTMILQSSSATIGVTMALASQGLLNFEASAALILGDNIGTTITAQLASIGASVNARRTARAHAIFNVLGVLLIISFFPFFLKMVIWITGHVMDIGPPDLLVHGEHPNIGRYIANAHTFFNVISALFFLMFLHYLVKVTCWLVPEKKEAQTIDELRRIKYIDSKYIDTPSVAIVQARAEIVRMGEAVQLMYNDVIHSMKNRKLEELSKWRQREDIIDSLQKEIIQFLISVMQKRVSPEESKEIASLMRMANNLERAGDGVENIAELLEELFEENLHLSEGGIHDYEQISKKVEAFLDLIVKGIKAEDQEIMIRAQQLENDIDGMREDMRGNYIMRLQSGLCTVDPGLIFVDMLTSFEKIGDFCYNVAQAVAGLK
jgi:phosphate:Na+ symporter